MAGKAQVFLLLWKMLLDAKESNEWGRGDYSEVLLGVRFYFSVCNLFCLFLYNLYLFMNLLEMLLYLFK